MAKGAALESVPISHMLRQKCLNFAFCRVLARQVAEKAPDALDRLGDRLEAVGIREADIVLAEGAETGAGDRRHPGVIEQLALKAAGVEPGPGNIGKGVERAARLGTADARQAVQRRDDDLAPSAKARTMRATGSRDLQRGDPGKLRRRIERRNGS